MNERVADVVMTTGSFTYPRRADARPLGANRSCGYSLVVSVGVGVGVDVGAGAAALTVIVPLWDPR